VQFTDPLFLARKEQILTLLTDLTMGVFQEARDDGSFHLKGGEYVVLSLWPVLLKIFQHAA